MRSLAFSSSGSSLAASWPVTPQKLFGWFGGAGLEGTAGWMESMRLRPGTVWARLAGGSELGGGLLTALGFLNPLGRSPPWARCRWRGRRSTSATPCGARRAG